MVRIDQLTDDDLAALAREMRKMMWLAQNRVWPGSISTLRDRECVLKFLALYSEGKADLSTRDLSHRDAKENP